MATPRSSRLLALILVAAQALSLGHLLLVPHTISPIDGGLLHTSHASRSEQVKPATPPPSDSLRQAIDTASHTSSHCPVADTLRRTPGTPGPAVAAHLGPPDLSSFARPMDVLRERAGASLHRLAPKQSPPV